MNKIEKINKEISGGKKCYRCPHCVDLVKDLHVEHLANIFLKELTVTLCQITHLFVCSSIHPSKQKENGFVF